MKNTTHRLSIVSTYFVGHASPSTKQAQCVQEARFSLLTFTRVHMTHTSAYTSIPQS